MLVSLTFSLLVHDVCVTAQNVGIQDNSICLFFSFIFLAYCDIVWSSFNPMLCLRFNPVCTILSNRKLSINVGAGRGQRGI